MKLFQSFNKDTITMCQYYCGELPLNYLLHIKTWNFYARINVEGFSPATLLYHWFGKEDSNEISNTYNILPTDSLLMAKEKIKASFCDVAKAIIG
jgi:hypothetical protein